MENVGTPAFDISENTFQGWYIYDPATQTYSNNAITFNKPISITTGEETSYTADSVIIKPDGSIDETEPDLILAVCPYYGPVHYITFYNSHDMDIIFNRIQVPQGNEYDISAQKAIPPDAIPQYNDEGELIGYTPVSFAFYAWGNQPGKSYEDKQYEVSDTKIVVNADLEFWPIFVKANWVNFHTAPSGEGATYIAPVYVLSGETTAAARPSTTPVWEGHSFVGWFTDSDSDYLSKDESADGAYQFNETLSEDINLYAHWNAGKANYTIIYWSQLVTDEKGAADSDKHYEYTGQENHVGDVMSVITPGEDATIPDGFMMNSIRTDKSVTVTADGTAVLNVYLDRKLVTMTFEGLDSSTHEQVPVYTEDETGELYGDIGGGQYIRIYKKEDTGPHYEFMYTYTPDDSDNGVYGLLGNENDKFYYQLENTQRYSLDGATVYTGQRYSKADNNSGTQIGVVDGKIINLTKRNSGWWYRVNNQWEQYFGDRYKADRNGIYGYAPNQGIQEMQLINAWGYYTYDGFVSYDGQRYSRENGGDVYDGDVIEHWPYYYQYGLDENGVEVPLNYVEGKSSWYYFDSNGDEQVYLGDRYKMTTITGAAVYTGLYGQTLEQNRYTWPDGIWWYNGQGFPFLREFIPPHEEYRMDFTKGNASNSRKVYVYFQNVDGTYSSSADIESSLADNSVSWTFSEKFTGFTIDSYQLGRSDSGNHGQNGNAGYWTSTSQDATIDLSRNTSLGIKYRRVEYTVKFIDSRTGKELSDIPSVNVPYGSILNTVKPEVDDITPPSSQYKWTGIWYADKECTKEFDFSQSMPSHDIAVYVTWSEIWYWVKIDPDGGALTGTESTWFWTTLGKKVEEYHDVTRSYVESEDGTWYYHYDEFNPETELNQFGKDERKAYYTQDSSLSTDGKKYKEDPKAYSLVGWYQVMEDGTMQPYSFDSGVAGNTTLKAIWRTVGNYHVKYSVEGVDPDGNEVKYPNDYEKEELRDKRVTGNDAPNDSHAYADKSNSSIMGPIGTSPSGYTFMGWYYNNHVYNPGDAYMIDASLAVENAYGDKEIWIYPVFVATEDLPVEVTQITWHGNGGTTEKTSDEGDGLIVKDDKTLINQVDLKINNNVSLDGTETYFTRPGYEFVGWSKSDGNNAGKVWLSYDSEKGYQLGTDKVSYVAADNKDKSIDQQGNITYNNDVYAIWKPKEYTLTVKKVVEGLAGDKETDFTFVPSGLGNAYQDNFSLHDNSSKDFKKLIYGTKFKITEPLEDTDFEVVVKMKVGDLDETTVKNGDEITLTDNTILTFVNIRKQQHIRFKKTDMSGNPLGEAVFTANFSGKQEISLISNSQNNGYLEQDKKDIFVVPVLNDDNSNPYVLSESEAPSGYVPIDNDIQLYVRKDGVSANIKGTKTTLSCEIDDNGVYTVIIPNSSGAALPMTGGHGRLPYTLIGLILIIGSGLMYGFRMRRRERRSY